MTSRTQVAKRKKNGKKGREDRRGRDIKITRLSRHVKALDTVLISLTK